MSRPRPPQSAGVASSGIRWRAALIVVAVVLTYANSATGPFVLDDEAAVVQNPQIRELWRLATVLNPDSDSPVAGRPLVNLSFALNYALGGLDVRGYHVFNVGFHVVCALLVFGLVRRTLNLPSLHFGGASDNVAFAAALLWAVHPLNSEVVDYLTQRSESLMGAFYLLTLYAANRAAANVSQPSTPPSRKAIRPKPDQPGRESGSRTVAWQAIAIGACAIGMLCKESMATAPLMVMLYDRVFVFDSWRTAFRARARLYAGLAAGWLVLATVVLTGPRSGVAGFSTGIDPWTYLLNQTAMILHYLRLSIWPRGLVVFYGWPAPLTLVNVLPQTLALLALFAATIIALVRWPPIGFLGMWFFVTLAPASSIIPVATEVGAERRMYLPLIALVTLVVIGADAIRKHWNSTRRFPAVPAVAVIVVAAVLAAATIVRNRDYGSTLTLAQTVVDRWPTAIAYHILGEQLLLAGRDADAIAPLQEAVARGDSRAGYPLAVAISNNGDLDGALQRLDTFVRTSQLPYRLVPRWLEPPRSEVVNAHVVMARIFTARHQWNNAAEQAELALKLLPSNADARGLLADALLHEEQWQRAGVEYAAYLQLRPEDATALMNLGITHAATGQFDEAVAAFRRALEVDPANTRARDLLAIALEDQRVRRAER